MTDTDKILMNISLVDLYQMTYGSPECQGKVTFNVKHHKMVKGDYSIHDSCEENPCLNVDLNRESVIRLKKYCEEALDSH